MTIMIRLFIKSLLKRLFILGEQISANNRPQIAGELNRISKQIRKLVTQRSQV